MKHLPAKNKFGTLFVLSSDMKRKMIILSLALCLFQFMQAQGRGGSSVAFEPVKHNAFKVGEKLTFLLHYGVVDAGTATLELRSCDKTVQGRKLVHAVGLGSSLGAFDTFFRVRDRYESYLDAESLIPWVFIRRVDEGGYKISQDYTFFQHKNKVKTEKGKVHDVPPSVQDMISAFYYARSMDFSKMKKGDTFVVNTFLDEELFPLKIKYIGKETISVRAGKFRCMKFRPVVQKGRIFKKEEDLNVWITDDANKIPVLAKAKILVGSIKMELTGYEGLANPISKVEKN